MCYFISLSGRFPYFQSRNTDHPHTFQSMRLAGLFSIPLHSSHEIIIDFALSFHHLFTLYLHQSGTVPAAFSLITFPRIMSCAGRGSTGSAVYSPRGRQPDENRHPPNRNRRFKPEPPFSLIIRRKDVKLLKSHAHR